MYKWHVHSAIGRGRPLASDFPKVADGIAASLRQFSVSASRTAEDGDAPRTTRSQRSAEALKEVSSLAPTPPRGIDARSLAAKPPQTFTIRRVDDSYSPRGGGRGGGSFIPRGRGDFRGGMRGRAGARGGRGRGGMRGRGGQRGGANARGIGGAARGKRVRGPKQKQEDDDGEIEPYTEEELAYIEGAEGGWPTPYNPDTGADTLARQGPPVISSPRGMTETVVYKLAVATGNNPPMFRPASEHLNKISMGNGTLFEDDEQKAIIQAFREQKGKELSKRNGIDYVPSEHVTPSKADSDAMTKQWIGGQYAGPKPAPVGDALAQVDTYARRNETYLPEDLRSLEEKIRSLLPAQNAKAKPGPVRKPL